LEFSGAWSPRSSLHCRPWRRLDQGGAIRVPPIVSCRHYKPGDQISYYITATPKKIPAYEAAKLASEFDPEKRDENVDYYVAKLDELVKKFRGLSDVTSAPKQVSLAL
jgi:hypothetical protein